MVTFRFFISWFPNPPDPRYWEWFDIDGIVISLASMKGTTLRKALDTGIHRFVGFDGLIMIDSGALSINNCRRDQREIFQLQRWLGADLAVHLDIPQIRRTHDRSCSDILQETIENAKKVRIMQKEYGDLEVIYVIQGWDLKSYRYCARELAQLDANYYGIGSLIRKSPVQIKTIVNCVRNIIGKSTKLHVFGISNFQTLGFLRQRIDSFDSASPVKASFVKEIMTPNFSRVNVNSNNKQLFCDCPVCKKFSKNIALVGLQGRLKHYTMLRAIHNAYVLTRFARSI